MAIKPEIGRISPKISHISALVFPYWQNKHPPEELKKKWQGEIRKAAEDPTHLFVTVTDSGEWGRISPKAKKFLEEARKQLGRRLIVVSHGITLKQGGSVKEGTDFTMMLEEPLRGKVRTAIKSRNVQLEDNVVLEGFGQHAGMCVDSRCMDLKEEFPHKNIRFIARRDLSAKEAPEVLEYEMRRGGMHLPDYLAMDDKRRQRAEAMINSGFIKPREIHELARRSKQGPDAGPVKFSRMLDMLMDKKELTGAS